MTCLRCQEFTISGFREAGPSERGEIMEAFARHKQYVHGWSQEIINIALDLLVVQANSMQAETGEEE